MESGKKEEAGPSRGVVNAEEKTDKQREMKTEKPLTISEVLLADEDEEEEYDDEDVKEGDGVVAGFSPGPLVSLKEQIEKDKVFFAFSFLLLLLFKASDCMFVFSFCS